MRPRGQLLRFRHRSRLSQPLRALPLLALALAGAACEPNRSATAERLSPALHAAARLPRVRAEASAAARDPNVPAPVPNDLLALPAIGSSGLRVLSPKVLELWIVTTKTPQGRVLDWDFQDESGALRLPDARDLRVSAGGRELAIARLGWKRRALHAALAKRDLRIGSYLYLELAEPIPDGALVEVTNPSAAVWEPRHVFLARAEPARWSSAIHVNQVGYLPDAPVKRAVVGAFLGSLGELDLPEPRSFTVIDAASGRAVFSGRLTRREEQGFTYPVPPYQHVFEADFSALKTPGRYRVKVPGLGVSLPFAIDQGTAAAFARAYALGLYHQRCGASNELPFTRFTHAPCHTAPASIPAEPKDQTPARAARTVPALSPAQIKSISERLARMSADAKKNPRHTAPQLAEVRACLYPFVRDGLVDAAGGHHDAGDYSKYTVNSAELIHSLVFAADSMGAAGELDNLGLPESGDGRSDLLQIAQWEAEFLIKMQDADGGFYFLVYPRDRSYESNVTPDKGDPQIVFPKNTSATAAAVAALAELASSPRFKKTWPAEAARYLKHAKAGWRFLEASLAAHPGDAAYQRVSHYGDTFLHDDELAWAATEMFLATGDAGAHRRLLASFDPASPATRRWGWGRLSASYGAAIRSYAFAERSGRVRKEALDAAHLAKCQQEIRAGADDQLRYAKGSSYGTSFPFESKRFRTAGWFFPAAAAFDLAVAYSLEPRPELLRGFLTNVDYEAGANPNDVVFVTGLGWKRQRALVSQYAENDRRALPPSGFPVGSVQAGPPYLEHYKKELGELSYPLDGAKDSAFPLYDRWTDAFHVQTEAVAATQARGLAALAMWMATTPLKDQPWRSAEARIEGAPREVEEGAAWTATLEAPGLDLESAVVVWESAGQEPVFGRSLPVVASAPGPLWIEAEAQWPDGRRAFAVHEITVVPKGTARVPP